MVWTDICFCLWIQDGLKRAQQNLLQNIVHKNTKSSVKLRSINQSIVPEHQQPMYIISTKANDQRKLVLMETERLISVMVLIKLPPEF